LGKKRVKPDEQLDELRELVSETAEKVEPRRKTDRRGMLRMAGAAMLGAAGAIAVRAVPAAAASGSYMVTGCVNSETSVTQISAPNTVIALGAQGNVGLEGVGNGATAASEVGVIGTSKSGSGTGVQGSAGGGVGVQGTATSGSAGWFQATTGWDLQLGQAIGGTIADPNFHGTGRLAMVGRTDVGGVAPNITPFFVTHSTLFAGGHFQHELVRGNDGSIWASTASMVGTNQSRWRRVNTVRTDSTDGTGVFFKPVRVLDTRSGAIKAPGSVTVVTMAGFGTGASNIPADAVAVMGNLTAAGYTGGGFLTIMPAGIGIGTGAGQYNPSADPSSVNFIVGQYAIANSFVCGLHTGQLQVYVGGPPLPGHSSHFIIDITAYLQ
jgi:hypothetical protein